MKLKIYIMNIVLLILFTAADFYVGIKIMAFLQTLCSINLQIYWILFFIISYSYIIVRIMQNHLPWIIFRIFYIVGCYWLSIMLNFLVVFPVIELILYTGKQTGMYFFLNTGSNYRLSLIGMITVFSIVIYGIFNARIPYIKKYKINIKKSANKLNQIHALMISDIHIGSVKSKHKLKKLCNIINKLNPDVIFLPGDVIDEDINASIIKTLKDTFLTLKTKYGIYQCMGNHEYLNKKADKTIKCLEDAGINVLNDKSVKINDSFYIVGREDISNKSITGRKRKSLNELIKGIDRSLPLILLDHQPVEFDEAASGGVDLELCGHTHYGQLFPVQLITKKIYEIDWGYLKKENLNIIVSCGFGTWGPSIRTSSRPEVVDIVISFNPDCV